MRPFISFLYQSFRFLLFFIFVLLITSCAGGESFMSAETLNRMAAQKRLQDGGVRTEFTVTEKTTRPKSFKTYYWYRSKAVHHTAGNYEGKLLDGEYSVFYPSDNLAVKGAFRKGLRNRKWQKWYENGRTKEISFYKMGKRKGVFVAYDSIGNILLKVLIKMGEDIKSGLLRVIAYITKEEYL